MRALRIFINDENTNTTYLDRFELQFGGTNSLAYQLAYDDPSSDNFQYFRGADLDANETSILERYKNYNGVQGNSPTSDQSTEEYPTSSTNLPDIEDINNDQTLSELESYYEYKIDLSPDALETIGANYINDIIENVGPNNNARWIQFKIPIREGESKGVIQDFKSIRFIRTFFQNFKEDVICRFATFELVRGEWRKYLNTLSLDGEIIDNNTQFDISVVNFEENGTRTPIPYVLPPGIQRETYYGATSLQEQNEQSMVLKVVNLEDGDARATFKNVSMDMRNYQNIEMYTHAEAILNEELNDGDVNLFLRIGTDYISNYYEYEIHN